ncbi:MAG TPA: TetR/AcrR family transcriptional regulator [Dongiaceae bacterium]|nr:TetR/AcrR family transcriptional regulator [Dongiaceae bacterium]
MDSTRQRILDAAEELFATHTFAATSLREVAAKVGIREPSLYAHYPGKDAIYGAVIDRALEPFMQELDSWNQSELTLRELFDIPRKLLNLHAQHPYRAQILHREFGNPREKISPKIMEWLELFAAKSALFMTHLPENHRIHIDRNKVIINIITLTNMMLGFFSSTGIQQTLLGDAYDRDALYSEHLRLMSKLFKSLLI